MIEVKGTHNTAVCFTNTLEDAAAEQIKTLCNQKAFAGAKIRIMPDVHAGKGCTIGFTANLGEKVIPNIVGVDLGCGMLTVELGKRDVDFPKLDSVIREHVPSGMNANDRIIYPFALSMLKCYDKLKEKDWIAKSLGSLGGGNHFIEVDTDENGVKYLVIHTGSRNLGKQVADYYQNVAIDRLQGRARLAMETRKLIDEYKATGREREIQAGIADLKKRFTPGADIPKELCYLTGEYRDAYLHDMEICQNFAALNRYMIARTIISHMGWSVDFQFNPSIYMTQRAIFNHIGWKDCGTFETIHNYVDLESNIIRKGAVSAKAGEKLLIPINMRDGSLICVGKGNPDWNYSAPHGAGRIMSRNAAFEKLSMEQFQAEMRGIYSTSVTKDTLDESPMAYKTMNDIVKQIGPTANIVQHIRPIYNFKAS